MNAPTPSAEIDAIIAKHDGWKGELLARLRAVITAVDTGIVEETKWKMPSLPEGRPVWALGGTLCFVEIWKSDVKLLFPNGAQLPDPDKLFNARLQSTDIRAIEFHEDDSVNAPALQALVREAIALNE